jgi:tRNA threonylcarbamoyladenosine biosynthesis protein TsaB
MKILALELSTARGSLAWLEAEEQPARAPTAAREGACAPRDRELDFRDWPNDRKNSGPFFANLDAVTRKFGSPDIVLVGLGPGSYAGTRIAISAGIGLQVASNARLIGFPSICAMECEFQDYCVIGDARRKSFFFAHIRMHELIEGPGLASEEELKSKVASMGNDVPVLCSESLPQFERAVIRYPSAVLLARLALDPRRSFSSSPLEPIYLREPYITTPKVASSK